jgi:uncharacterized protein YraI
MMMKNFVTLTRKWLWLIMALVLLLIGPGFVSGAMAQGDNAPQLTVVSPVLSVRTGPDMTYEVIDYLRQGERVTAIGYDVDSDWWQVELPDGNSGWVSGKSYYVSVEGDPSVFVTPQPDAVIATSSLAVEKSRPGTIVFQTASGGPIYAIDADGTNLRYLTTGMDPVISPDGQWVVFTRWETSQDGKPGNVWIINVDGTGERVIHENVLNPRTPTWSSDGTKIVISMQHGGHADEIYKCWGERPPREAYDVEVDRYERDDIEFCFTLPPDPHWGLRLIDVATGASQDLRGDTYSFSPAWDPNNGQHLVYDGDFGLVNLDLVENKTSALTGDFNDHSPVFSRDGSKIAVSYRQDVHWEVHVMNADGSGRQRLTQTSYITFAEQQFRGEQPHSFNNAAPTWSPDGSQIAFLTDRTGQWEIWVMNADGSNQHPLFDPAAQAQLGLQYNGVDEHMLSWGQ